MQTESAAATNLPEENLGTTRQMVTFKLMEEDFGIPILDVREIIRPTAVTPVPQAPHFVEGVINLRGQIIPIVDLRKRFGMTDTQINDDSRIIVVELGSVVIGLVVDQVEEVLRIPAESIAPTPGLVAGSIGAEYIQGISHFNNMMLILIDLKKVFNVEELDALGSM